ncbi:hypothetical protein ACJ73_05073, partial [Blastomyces percursus]
LLCARPTSRVQYAARSILCGWCIFQDLPFCAQKAQFEQIRLQVGCLQWFVE